MDNAEIRPPKHKRYDSDKAPEYVRNRYLRFKQDLLPQIAILQVDEAFRLRCGELYQEGYKDWYILAVIHNIMLNRYWKSLNLSPIEYPRTVSSKDIQVAVEGKVYPADEILVEFNECVLMHHATILSNIWGFEIRRPTKMDCLARFHMERMGAFEDDLIHKPLFGDPIGDWPYLGDEVAE